MSTIKLRLVKGIRDHFEVRFSEWATTYALMGLGIVLAYNPHSFGVSNSFDFMASWASEYVWSLLLQIAATARLIALIINGTFRQRFPYSPHVRAGVSFFAAIIWGQIFVGFLLSYIYSNGSPTGIVIYSMVFGMDIWNVFRCMAEVGRQAVHGTR